MSAYLPPTEITPIYNPNNFPSSDPNADLLALFVPRTGGTFAGSVAFNLGLLADQSITIDSNSTEALISRQDGDSGDVLIVDNANSQVKFADGLEATPSLSFINDDTAGLYLKAPNTIAISTNSIERLAISDTGISSTFPIEFSRYLAGNGTTALPSFSFQSDDTTGIHLSGTSTLSFDTDATQRMRINTTDVISTLPITTTKLLASDGTDNLPSYSFSSDETTGLFNVGLGVLGLSANETTALEVHDDRLIPQVSIQSADEGLEGSPNYSWVIDPNTGLYHSSDDEMSLTCGGTDKVIVSTSNTTINNTFRTNSLLPADTSTSATATRLISVTAGSEYSPWLKFRTGASPTTKSGVMFSNFDVQNYLLSGDGSSSLILGHNTDDDLSASTTLISVSSTNTTFTNRVLIPDGTNSSPGLAFASDTGTNTGIYRIGENNLGLATGGALQLDINSTRVNFTVGLSLQGGTVLDHYSVTSTTVNILNGSSGNFFASGVVTHNTKLTRIGNMVSCIFINTLGTVGGTTSRIVLPAAVPVGYRPVVNTHLNAIMMNNNVQIMSYVNVNAGGNIDIFNGLNSSDSFASGTTVTGIRPSQIFWSIQ